MRYVSLFSGIEAATVAWEELGWEPVAFSEIEPFPCAVLENHFPNVPNLGDVTKINWKEFVDKHGSIDLIVGGSPCQSFSIAGGREGLDGESRLMFEYIRAVSEIRPRWFLWENVPGVFSTDAGRAFGILLNAMEELGYGLAWRVLDAQFFGVAQRRRRVFLVGSLAGGGASSAVLFESESVSGNTESSSKKRERLATSAKGDSRTICFDQQLITHPVNRSVPQPIAGSLNTKSSMTVCIQGGGDTSQTSNGSGVSDELSYTLNGVDRHGVVYCSTNTTSNSAIDEEVAGTLLAGGGWLMASNEQEFVGALCARDFKGIGNQDIQGGKLICQFTCSKCDTQAPPT